MNLLILPAHKIWSRGSTVVGDVLATYDADWLCDGASSMPLQGATNTEAYTATFPVAGDVNFLAMINANVVDVDVDVSGGVTETLTVNPLRPNGLRRNPYKYFATVVGVASLTITITGNTGTPIIGEFVAGEASEFERHIRPGSSRSSYAHSIPRGDDIDFLPDLDLNAYGRTMSFEIIATRAGAEWLEEWEDGTRANSAGSVIVPDTDRNDARWGRLSNRIAFTRRGPDEFLCRVDFREFAMKRWR